MRPWHRVALGMFAVGWGANQFSPMLVVYRDELHLSAQTRAILFGVYAAGLIPGLLIGGAASDRYGRRPVVTPFVLLSPLATLLLITLRHETLGIGAGRFLAGVCSGVVFGAATAWLRELTTDDERRNPGTAARRSAIALTSGFAAGPLVASIVADTAPDPLWVPYLPHLVLGTFAALTILDAVEPQLPRDPRSPLIRIPHVTRTPRFGRTVVIVAPWVFACASMPFAVLPVEIGAHGHAALLAGVAGALALGTGVAVQPFAKRVEDVQPLLSGAVGLVAAAVGMGVGILAIHHHSPLLILVSAPLFGVGYGGCLIAGLRETERIAAPEELGATVSVFYALTYLGFATPYIVELLNGVLDQQRALAALAGVALLCLAVSSTAGRAQ